MARTIFKTLTVLIICVFGFITVGFAEEGVTDTEIHIGTFGPQTGPAAPWGQAVHGMRLLFKIVNEEGGIAGKKIILHDFDDSYNPAKSKAGVKRLQESIGMFIWVGGIGTSNCLAVKDYLMKRNIPWVAPLSGSSLWVNPPEKNIFAVYAQYYTDARMLCRYAVKKLNKKRFAIIYQNDDYGESGLKGTKDELAKQGLELQFGVPVERGESNLKADLLKFKKADVDVVLLFMSPYSAFRGLNDAKKMKYSPQWMMPTTGQDYRQLYKLSKGLWKDMITTAFFNFEACPKEQKYKDMSKKLSPDKIFDIFYIGGIGFVEPVVQALKNCGNDITRERFVKEMEKVKVHCMGPPISFKPFNANDPSCRLGVKKIWIGKCLEGGDYENLTGWIGLDSKL